MVEVAEATKPDGGESHDKDANEAVASPPPAPTEALASVSLHIWPPSQRTRDAVIQHMVETVTASSILSKRYGVLPHEEASATARLIEEEAFAAAAADAAGGKATSVDDEIEILQIYSKEVSSRMMKAIKERGSSASSSPTVVDAAAKVTPVPVDSSASSSPTVADAAAKVTPVPVDSSPSDIGVGEESASQQV